MENKKDNDKNQTGRKTKLLITLLILLLLSLLLIFFCQLQKEPPTASGLPDTSQVLPDSADASDTLVVVDTAAVDTIDTDNSRYGADGYDSDGYDRRGYGRDGYNRAGFGRDGFNRDGYNKDGYGRDGYDKDGFDRGGYDTDGYNRDGFDRDGFDRDGYDTDGYNRDGFDRDGFDRDGYDKDGYNRDGFDRDDFNRDGYNKDGYNRDGFGRDGFNRDGYDKDGYNRSGYNREGKDRAGLKSVDMDPCARDTVAPWVYADPSGGLHRKAVSVKLVANKTCKIYWSFDGVKDWKLYTGQPIKISKAVTLYYKASDSCGKEMDVRSKRYEFDFTQAAPMCPPDMEHVKVGGKELCVDAYQWPNRKGAVPNAFVSLYQAMDSCFSVRKRLCSSDEWTAACSGPEKWKYLYGEAYESNACVTRDTSVQKSGSKPECRGYYAVFDMSGNLGEWTSTPAAADRSFNNVMGGYWASGNQSRCSDARYSYYPQNRHNPVGFRCCKDAEPQGSDPVKPKGSGH